MKALCFTVLLASSAHAQTKAIADPQGVMTEQDRAKKAAEEFKVYTDSFRVPSGDPFPPPPAITLFTAKEVDTLNFSFNNQRLAAYSKQMSEYIDRFDWDEENPSDQIKMDAERFQVAFGLASKGGKDLEAAGRWVCGLSVSARAYFHFYNEQDGGSKGSQIGHAVWGVGAGPVVKMQILNGWISKRYKEASKVDLGQGENSRLNYASVDSCVKAVMEATKEQAPKPEAKLIPSIMHIPEQNQEYIPDGGPTPPFDFTKNEYWVFYYDANWQPWSMVAKNERKWKNTPESLQKFVLCRAPVWVGNYVKYRPLDPKKGGFRTLRHPLQPAKAQLRDKKLIAEHQKKYCR